jgi:uncharacterized NAD-dependent epimerase/dehydratase family protein
VSAGRRQAADAGGGAGGDAGALPARPVDGRAIVWCEGAFLTPECKTAHGLVRRTARYDVVGLVDRKHAGGDAGQLLDGRKRDIPVHTDVDAAVEGARTAGREATHLVVGLAPDGGRLPEHGKVAVKAAIRAGLHVDSGLHDFLTDDPDLVALAQAAGVTLRDVRRSPPRDRLHFFTGRIAQVPAIRVAVLGTDSAVGKRTTAWLLIDALREAGVKAELIGTGQTAWMQGVKHGILLDSLVNDYVTGEIEHAILQCWEDSHPRVIVLEGQGSLLHPAYPGGFELLAAGQPAAVVLQHAPKRQVYDGFPGFPLHPLARQIAAVEAVSDARVVAITVNHEDMQPSEVRPACVDIQRRTGRQCCDPLLEGAGAVVEALAPLLGL